MGEIRTKTSQASQKARVVPAPTRLVAELEEKWLKSASHLENLREQMTRKEQDYIASMSRSEEHEKLVEKLEAEYREAKNLLVTPVPSDHSDVGSACEKEGSEGGVVSDMEIQNVEDDDEFHDLDLISGDTCKGDPPPEPKRVRTKPPKSKAPPPVHLLRMLIGTCFLRLLRRGSSRVMKLRKLLTSTCNLRFVRLLDQGCLGSDREAHGGKDLEGSEDGWKVVNRKVRKSLNFEIVFQRAASGSLFKETFLVSPQSKVDLGLMIWSRFQSGPGPVSVLGPVVSPGSNFGSGSVSCANAPTDIFSV